MQEEGNGAARAEIKISAYYKAEPAPSRIGLMLDIETLGTRPGCVILSIGAILYDMSNMEGFSNFAVNLSVVDQMVAGFTVDPSTLTFWRDQPADALEASTISAVPPAMALEQFCKWVEWDTKSNPFEVVTRGTDFDIPILRHALEHFGMKLPWHHRTPRDLRTILSTLGFDESTVVRSENDVGHSAIGDCRHQLRVLAAARANRRVIDASALIEGQ